MYGPVAQLVRAPPCHGGGHEFESRLGRFRPRDCPREAREGPVVTSEASDVRLRSSARTCAARPYIMRSMINTLRPRDCPIDINYAGVAELADARDLKSRG